MYQDEDNLPRASARAGEVLNKLERAYLAAIRAIALVAATLLVAYALWLALSGMYKSSRDVSSVKEAPAAVSPEEVIQVDLKKATAPRGAKAEPLAAEKAYYADFTKRYFNLFNAKFQPFRKQDDRVLDQKAFDARYVQAGDRIKAIGEGDINFQQDRDDLESLLTTMTTVSSSGTTIQRLNEYKTAKKYAVTRTMSGTREEAYCSYYGYYVDACLSYDTQTVPYTRTVTEMKLPAGVISHTDLFGAYQDRYLTMLSDRRHANALTAEGERNAIIADNADGRARLWTALGVIGGFVVVMFLFLLIALERHQRKIATLATSKEAD